MNKRFLLCLPLLGLCLVSCEDTKQLYFQGQYLSGSFINHVYNVWDGETKNGHDHIVYSKELHNEHTGFFMGSGVAVTLSYDASADITSHFTFESSDLIALTQKHSQSVETTSSDVLGHLTLSSDGTFAYRYENGATSFEENGTWSYEVPTLTLTSPGDKRYQGSVNTSEPPSFSRNKQAKAWHPEYFRTKEGKELIWGNGDGSDIVPGAAGVYVDNSSLYETVYSQHYRLDRFYENFSRGYLSKLYNGQIKCNGWSYYAMVVVSDEGFGSMFPYELKSAEYFATSILAGTDYEIGRRVVQADVEYTFYKYGKSGLEGYQVTLKDVLLSCNSAAANTSLVGFRFADAGFSPESIVGFSVKWGFVADRSLSDQGIAISGDFKKEGQHDGLALYEVIMPDSVWY